MLAGGLWMIMFGALGTNTRGYAWASIIAGLLAWAVAALLVRLGDRGVAVGVAVGAAAGLSITIILVIAKWVGGVWILW
jgi:hypothetical protein